MRPIAKLRKGIQVYLQNRQLKTLLVEARRRGVRVPSYVKSYMWGYNTRHGSGRMITPKELTALREIIKSHPKESINPFAPAEMVHALTLQPHGPKRRLVMDLLGQSKIPKGAVCDFSERELARIRSVPEGFHINPKKLEEIGRIPGGEGQIDAILAEMGQEGQNIITEKRKRQKKKPGFL